MQDPIYNEIIEKPRPSLFAVSGFVLLAAVGLWASVLVELALPPQTSALLVNAAYYLPFIALPLLLYARRRPEIAGSLRLKPPLLRSAIALALMAVLSVYIASAASIAWDFALDALGLHSPGSVPMPQDKQGLTLAIVGMAALPAVCEELLFRGFALAAWETRGTACAIAVTSVLFALLHGNVYGLPSYLLVGAIAGYVTFALDTVYAGIIYHTVYNAACLIISYMQGTGGADVGMSLSMVIAIVMELFVMAGVMALLIAAFWFQVKLRCVTLIPRIRRPLETREKLMLWAAVGVMVASTLIVTVMARYF